MNKTLMQNWNSCITAGDDIYILGDLVFKGTGSEVNKIIEQLNGKKYLIKGNHDSFIDGNSFNTDNFEWIKDYYVLNYEKIKFILFHYPIFEWDGYFGDAIHLYGHVHNCGKNKEQSKRFETLGKKAVNVGVDVNNYYPISIQTIIKIVK